ncbi:MAG TPA: hypothetical protein ENK02_09200 [Planctomycetes bacterium]|nr:hypothetical protein [Planctomycetota bacterium]
METLRQRLARGPLDPEEFLRFARNLAALAWEEHAQNLLFAPLSPEHILWDGARIEIQAEPQPSERAGEDSRKNDQEEALALRENIRELGTLLFWAGTGETPRDPGPLPSHLREELPLFWDGVLSNCLHPNPMERFAHAGDLLRALPPAPMPSPPSPEDSEAPQSRTAACLLGALLLLFLGAYLLGFEIHDHGRSYDDLVQRGRGEAVLNFLRSGDRSMLPGKDPEDFSRGDRLYGPFAATLSVWAGKRIAPWVGNPDIELHLPFHTGLSLFGVLLVLCCYLLGLRLLKDPGAALATALLFLALPRVFGQLTSNPSDLPAAALMALSAVMLFRWFDRPNLARTLGLALALGALGATRMQNGGLMAVLCLAPILLRFFRGPESSPLPLRNLLLLPLLSYAFLVLFWPDFWSAPLTGPFEVLRDFFHHKSRYSQGTLFFGTLRTQAPLYPMVLLFLTTPVTILALSLLGLLRKKPNLLQVFLILWVLLSLGKHLTGIANHGGIRHFLDAFVPIALFAGMGLQRGLKLLGIHRWRKTAALGSALLLLALSISTHPFESSYYNLWIGGTPGAVSRFDLDSNGSSFLILMKGLRPKLRSGDILLIPGSKDLVTQVPLPPNCPVFPLRPGQRALVEKAIQAGLFQGRRCILLFHQGILWGKLDSLIRTKRLQPILQTGPKGLPLSMALLLPDPRDLLEVLDRLESPK